MSVQLNWLRTFVTVYRLGSFTKAAQKLGMSQPAVTHQIRNLEKEIGWLLFERLPHGAQPTPAADGLLREVQGPVDALSNAVDSAYGKEAPRRPLYVGGPTELMTSRLIPAISDLVAEGIRFRFVFGLADDLLTRLVEGELDLVLSTIRPRIRSIAASPLFDEEFVLLASAELAARIPRERLAADGPAVLSELPWISYAESLPIIRRYWRGVFDAAPDMTPAIVVPDLRGALAAVKSSAGVSVLPTYLCAEELASGAIVPLLQPEVPPINTFYLAHRQGEFSRPDLTLLHGHLLLKGRLWS
ncbi:LysR family transcriptional regulator [Streptomyces calidiresistens]|uniref:LysR family transcriptional regulator n=1 Tax=Streptomyces calidiresistens TaxID=1485586 RepID=A0A7W3T3U6_9ACTN|nr:LysR family transcriptional regulator [Streptomyces calidiresistens]MBB0230444.1 LysR family transcriptional regulator [Streptomyces calidiresistens]